MAKRRPLKLPPAVGTQATTGAFAPPTASSCVRPSACYKSTGDTVDTSDGASPLFSLSGRMRNGRFWYWGNPGNGTPELSALSVFFGSSDKMGHAVLPLLPPSFPTAFRRGNLPACLGAAAACRYTNTVASYTDGWLLLPLCGFEAAGRLRKDV